MKAVVLFSGGLDSTTCLAMAVSEYGAENVIALSLRYGQKHSKEIACARELTRYYGVHHIEYDVAEIFRGSNCSLINEEQVIPHGTYAEQLKTADVVSTYVPFRNGLFISIAASIALVNNCEAVYYGAHKDDAAGNAYPDCSEKFNAYMTLAIFEGTGGKVRLKAPFIKRTKSEIVAEGVKLKVPYELTWSCYEGGDIPCGKCGTCIDRIKAFKLNGLEDPLCYR